MSKSDILDRVRHANGRKESVSFKTALARRDRDITTERQRPIWDNATLTRFATQAEQASARIHRLGGKDNIVEVMTKVLGESDVSLVHSGVFPDLAFPNTWRVSSNRQDAAEATATLTRAPLAVAETGTLVLPSSPEQPTGLHFLPETAFVMLDPRDIVDHMEDAWDKLRQDGNAMPRAVNFITGPSRTADVEQTIQLGAHGPRHLHILLLVLN